MRISADDNSNDYHKCESWHICFPVNRVASIHLVLVHLHCNVNWFGQLSGPRANLTHQTEERNKCVSMSVAKPVTIEFQDKLKW